jgi:hypothetical protein
MEQYTNSIGLLLQHGQRFFEIWDFQIIIAVAAIGFIMSREGLVSKDRVRVHITILFLLIAIFSVYTESIHHQRETLVWRAPEARVASAPGQFTYDQGRRTGCRRLVGDRDYVDESADERGMTSVEIAV